MRLADPPTKQAFVPWMIESVPTRQPAGCRSEKLTVCKVELRIHPGKSVGWRT
jgi:hypothetical protein